MAYCTSCGTPLAPGERFCTGCGAAAAPLAPPGRPPLPGRAADGSTVADTGWVAEGAGPRRRSVLVPVIALIVVVLAGGAGVWAAFGRSGSSTSTVPSGPAALAPAASSTGAPDATTGPLTTDPAPPTFSSDGFTTPTTGPVDPDTVQLSPGVGSPAATTVVSLMQSYFTAINNLDYGSYAAAMLRPSSASSFASGYRSVHDSQVVISSIEPTGADSATVVLSFVSTQDIDQAPPTLRVPRICWQQRLPVTQLAAGGKIGTPVAGSTTMRQC